MKINPEDLPSLRLRMEINEEMQNFSGALEDSDRLLKSGRADAYDMLIRVYCKTALKLPPENILPDAVKATELNLADPEAWFHRGSLEDALNDFETAVQSFSRSIALEPTAAAFACRAESLSCLGRKDEALEDFNRAIENDPDDIECYAERGTLLAALGRRDEALKDLTRFLEKSPDDAQALSCRGAVYADMENFPAAKVDLERSLVVRPDPETSYRLSGVLNMLGEYRRAAEQSDLAVRGVPDDPDYNFWRGVLLLDDGDEKSAAIFFRKAVDCADEESLPYFLAEIGRLYKGS
ncbi:MAG: tetratricopeptide repeat protein [Victivallaceae bacterium]|nr:tetratricopeptide repeat protein [Victivallaceae bacterium]